MRRAFDRVLQVHAAAIIIALRAGVARGLSPLVRLQKAVASRSPYDLSPVRIIAEIPGEVRPLLQSINVLLERLSRAMTLQSRFVADATSR